VNIERDDAGRGTKEASLNAEAEAEAEAERRTRQAIAWPRVGIVGAGAVGTALGVAISRTGWPVVAVASRDPDRRDRFRALVPGARALAEPAAVPETADLIIVAVPDDAIAEVAGQIRLRSGQAIVHTSGAVGPEVLAVAVIEGGDVGAFHPLVSFTADVERSIAGIAGTTIAIEGDDRLVGLLSELALAIGGTTVRLLPGTKAAYHAAAVLASGGLVALLDAVVALGAVAGLNERDSLALYGRLAEQTLANALGVGIAASLTGPIARGDVGTVAAHIAALEAHALDVVELYVATARRQLRIAEDRGALSPHQAARVGRLLAKER
jgi:predicted short-subunit dehydrogenase-like oxidoreductase (DUF2520 family)